MSKRLNISWRTFAQTTQICGAAGCFAVSVIQIALIGYYSYVRPAHPVPQRGWSLQLPWTHVVYGSAQDADQLLRVGPYFWLFAALALVGVGIEKFAGKREKT